MTDYVADFNLNDGDEFDAEFELEEEEYNALLELNVVGSLWGNITGDISNQIDLQQALNNKADILYVDSIQSGLNDQINALDSVVSSNYTELNDKIETNTGNIDSINSIIGGYGDIVTYNASYFADSAQGALADTAVQSVTTGTANGTINVDGTNVAVYGLGSAAYTESSDYATSVQGGLADTAVQPSDLATVATTGDYDDLINKPTIPTVNDGKLAIQVNSVDIGEFTANQATATTVNISVPTDTSDLTNGAGFLINNATGTKAFAVANLSQSTAEGGVAVGYGARANSTYSTAVGQETRATNTNTTVIGRAAKATEARAIAIGSGAEANAQDAIAIKGINNTANTFQVYTYNVLDMSTGLIPDARISTNIARVSDMQTADNGLQSQIDAITASSDVTDIVGTYAELQAYDTTTLAPNSIIKVLQDESQNDETTYYRWVITGGVGSWVLIGEEGPYYTKSEANSTFVPQTRTVNNKALSSDITLTASDVGALPDSTVIPTVNNSSVEFQINGAGFDTITLNQSSNDTINITVPTDTSDLTNGAGYITAASLPTDYYTKSEINALIPQPTKVPVVYYQPTNSYCYTESNNRFYGSHVYEKLYLVKPKTSGTAQVIDMSDTFSLLFTIDYTSAPSSAITVAEIMVSYAAGKGVLLQLNSTGLYYRNNITGTTITGTRALTAGNSYDVKVEYDGTHMIISYKLSSDVNYTQANSTTCTCSGSNYNYAAVGMNVNYGDIALSSVTLTNGGNTLYSYTAGQIALDYDSSLTLNDSNQLKVVVDQTYNSASTNPQSGVAIAGAGFITGITSGDVITALGYTPYSDANPNGYTSNVGTVTSVNNTSPDGNGNVTLTIPAAQVNSDWNANSGVAEILNKPTLATVATSGLYSDLTGTPTIPTSLSDITVSAGSNISISGDTISATDTTYSDFVGCDSITAGSAGLVPAPSAGDESKFLKADGTWDTIPSGASSLSGLSDVNITSIADGELIKYDSNSSKWINFTPNYISSIPSSYLQNQTSLGLAINRGNAVVPQGGLGSITLGTNSQAGGSYSIAIGNNSQVDISADYAIQIGAGTNSTPSTLNVGFNANNYQLLTSAGKIPNARLNLDTIPASGSGNAITSGAVYTALSDKQNTSTAVTHTASTAVGDSDTPVYIASDGTATSTGKSIASTRFDGQIVQKILALDTSSSVHATSYNLGTSGYLPADYTDYVYLVFGQLQGSTSNSTVSYGTVGTVASPEDNDCIKARIEGNANARRTDNFFIIPVTNGNIYTQVKQQAWASFRCDLYGYRRLGTNS